MDICFENKGKKSIFASHFDSYTICLMATIRIVERHEELNSLGCEFFTKACENHITRVSSTKLSWLSIRDGNGGFISPMQEQACSFLDNIVENYGSDDWNKLNMKILLYENPINTQDKYIKCLLKCGVDLRYLRTNDCSKIVIQDNIIYLTFASSFEKVVNSGIYYVGKKISDPFIDYNILEFDSKFNKAKKLTLKNEKIVYADRFFSRLTKELNGVAMKDWINLFLGALLGGLVSIVMGILL